MKDLLTTFRLFLLTMLVCCVVYPLTVMGFAMTVVPEKSRGSLIYNEAGEIIGSNLIAQSFTSPEYFWPRPSAVDFNASATGGSNLSPMNPAITQRASEAIAKLNLVAGKLVPPDLVTTSGSGLDPHITYAAAEVQVDRVALARGMDVDRVKKFIDRATDSPTLVWLGGEPLVHVLRLNQLLDDASSVQ